MIFLIMMKLMLDDPLKKNDCEAESGIHGLQTDPRRSFFHLILVDDSSLNMNDSPEDDDHPKDDDDHEDDDHHEEDAVAKEATSASIEPLAGHPRAIVAH